MLISVARLLFQPTTKLGFTHFCYKSSLFSFSVFTIRPFSESSNKHQKNVNSESFTVSYLINSCGLTPEAATLASRRVKFRSPERPDLVLSFFRDHGFTDLQISKLVRTKPNLLTGDPGKNVLPKFEFFYSIGISVNDLAKLVSTCPVILARSLDNHLIPSYNFFKSILVREEKVISLFKTTPRIILENVEKNIGPNIMVLRNLGASKYSISLFVSRCQRVVVTDHSKFKSDVEKVIEMGFKLWSPTFFLALQVISHMSTTTWENKVEVYKKWGWSEEEISSVFRRHPIFMATSEKKIESVMDFLVNKMEFKLAHIVRCPKIFCSSLEKRIIPRFSVIKTLLSHSLVKEDVGLSYVPLLTDKSFLEKFVIRHQKHLPQLLDIFEGKLAYGSVVLVS